jgi:uncharacterized damage-inducible protein DinB
MKPSPQSEYAETLLRSNREVLQRIERAVADMDGDVLSRRPPDGGWSIAEVLEHLIVSADSYVESIRRVMGENPEKRAAASTTWKPSIMGGMLVSSFRNPRKLPAPRMYQPGPSPRANTYEEFVRRQQEVGRLITEAQPLDWRAVRMRSPVIPLIRMNLGDALSVLVVHAERHAGQIERVRKSLGTPGSQGAPGNRGANPTNT